MNNLLPQFSEYKERIPQFIVKLYHILQLKQYSDYLAWNGESEIHIKNIKKLQQKVLPNFFRHKHVSSFIRQLNMYRFSKVNKLTKQKNSIYFKNEHFRRGNIKLLTKIKRNHKKNKSEENSPEQNSDEVKSENISINRELQANTALSEYKQYVKNIVGQMIKSIRRIQSAHPETKTELSQAIVKCNELLELPTDASNNNSFLSFDESLQNKNMMSTMKLLPVMDPILFSSQCSFFHIN